MELVYQRVSINSYTLLNALDRDTGYVNVIQSSEVCTFGWTVNRANRVRW